VGAGKISSHSTGTATSKFGIGLQDDRKRVLDAYSRNPWLNAVHVHVGSQVR
jgi:diaminopimelate decarboxylase